MGERSNRMTVARAEDGDSLGRAQGECDVMRLNGTWRELKHMILLFPARIKKRGTPATKNNKDEQLFFTSSSLPMFVLNVTHRSRCF